MWQYYQANFPGQVQVLSADVYNGTPAELESFKNATGATYPLLLKGTEATGGNLYTLYYPDTDDYIVINKQGIVRYHAADLHGHGTRYVLSELRGSIDSLVSAPTAVGDPPRMSGLALDIGPNPFGAATTVTFVHPGDRPIPLRITVHDLAGRRIARLWDAPALAGKTMVRWSGAGERGERVPAGLYLIRAEAAGRVLVRRVARLR